MTINFVNEWRSNSGRTRTPVRREGTIMRPIKVVVDHKKAKPEKNIEVHVFSKNRVWEKKYEGKSLRFRIFMLDEKSTINQIIRKVMRLDEDETAYGWALSEAFENGDGKWEKGSTIKYGSNLASLTLKDLGWADRGKSLPPVWVCVHKHCVSWKT